MSSKPKNAVAKNHLGGVPPLTIAEIQRRNQSSNAKEGSQALNIRAQLNQIRATVGMVCGSLTLMHEAADGTLPGSELKASDRASQPAQAPETLSSLTNDITALAERAANMATALHTKLSGGS